MVEKLKIEHLASGALQYLGGNGVSGTCSGTRFTGKEWCDGRIRKTCGEGGFEAPLARRAEGGGRPRSVALLEGRDSADVTHVRDVVLNRACPVLQAFPSQFLDEVGSHPAHRA